ncbi:MAG: sel1 repeat family protein [Candidatus Melainabacteria bacterium]|nr:sel1 repeat family protein [Candidatus Melainabacteria bacterium]
MSEHADTPDLEELKRRAVEGDRESQARLGFAFATGRGVERDPSQALIWYRKAAESGHVAAQYNVADMCLARRDYDGALAWFSKAAASGDPDASFNIALLHQRGLGVAQDDAEAVRWFKLAAEAGSARAMYDLGLAYLEGRGVASDADSARTWLTRAAVAGVSGAREVLEALKSN